MKSEPSVVRLIGPLLDLARLGVTVGERLRVLIVAGIPVGVLVAGIGGRIAMLALRLTSPDSVLGVTSDDGFTIGRVTLAGTYDLLLIGAGVGIIGAAAYRAVAPWLLGPRWFRRCTVAAASGVVVGSMLVHADGVDFTLLEPAWLAIGLFVLLPAVFGWMIGAVVDRVASSRSWTAQGRWRWLLPIALVACFAPTLVLLALAVPVLAGWSLIRRLGAGRPVPPVVGLCVRATWLSIAVVGLIALVRDVDAIT